MSDQEYDPTEDVVTQETGNVFPEAHQRVKAVGRLTGLTHLFR